MKRIIISVSNDLVTDQRVHRTALTLSEFFDVTVVGRKLPRSLPVSDLPYKTIRLNLIFTKGPLFYVMLNVRLFFFLFFKKTDLLLSNDLDTLLPNFLISKLKGIELYYDSHEYFTGVPELQNRPFVKNFWTSIEKWIFPQLKYVYTVNNSIADLYRTEYGVDVKVVRNVPLKIKIENENRSSLDLPENKKIIIFQGAGINVDRGAEEVLLAMKFLPDEYVLLFIGGGDVFDKLKQLASMHQLNDKIIFIPKVRYEKLRQYTACTDLGLTLDKDSNINYRFSLPNKIFDYIHAGVPVLSSKLVEIEKLIKQYNIGKVIETHDPELIAQKIVEMLNSNQYPVWKNNTIIASKELNWDVERKKLLEIFRLKE